MHCADDEDCAQPKTKRKAADDDGGDDDDDDDDGYESGEASDDEDDLVKQERYLSGTVHVSYTLRSIASESIIIIVFVFTLFAGPLTDGRRRVGRSQTYPLVPALGCGPALHALWDKINRVCRFVRNTTRRLFNVRVGQVLYTADGKLPEVGDTLSGELRRRCFSGHSLFLSLALKVLCLPCCVAVETMRSYMEWYFKLPHTEGYVSPYVLQPSANGRGFERGQGAHRVFFARSAEFCPG